MTADGDAPTPVSVYAHPYWQLGGQSAGSVLNHTLRLSAASYAPYLPGTGVPSGEFAPVDGTVYDFRQATRLGDRVDAKELGERGGAEGGRSTALRSCGCGCGHESRLRRAQGHRSLAAAAVARQ